MSFKERVRNHWVFVLIPIAFLSVGLWEGCAWYRFTTTPLLASGYTTVIVTPHLTVKRLAFELHARGLLSHPHFFLLLAHQRGVSNKLKVGEYALNPQITPKILLQNMVMGKVVMRKLTFVEGITMHQIRQILLNNDALQHVAVKQTDKEIMASLGSTAESSEGRFFPDTYVYTWGNKDTVILQQAYQRMTALLAEQWAQRADNLPYKSADEALIVASLVESETALPSERPIIAGVIIRRLQENMKLQIDTTVIYGSGKPYGSTVTMEDLRDDNPYNTYRHQGLPPTAINMPSAASIQAALHPVLGNALFYVAQSDGHHCFSATYAEHLQAIKRCRLFNQSEINPKKWLTLAQIEAIAT